MTDLTEKVEVLERQLDKLSEVFDHIRKSLTAKSPKGRQSVRTKTRSARPEWVEEIVQGFSEILAELKSVRKTLDIRSSITEIGSSQSDASATEAATEADLQHEPPQGQSEPKHVSPAGFEGGDRPVAADAAEQLEHTFSPLPPGQHIVHPVGEVSLTPSTSIESLSRAAHLNDALLDLQSEEVNAPIFHCNYEDISGNLNESKFVAFSSHPTVRRKGYFKLAVEGLPPLNVEDASFNQPGKDHCTNFSYQPTSQGCVEVVQGQNQDVEFPGFPLAASQRESWSRRWLKEFWESNLKDPPQDMLYVIGDPLFPDIELSSGAGLKRIGGDKLRGIGTTYIYLCFGVSFSIIHGEDAKFRSMNLLRSGEHKLWLVVEPACEKELELRMRQEFPKMAKCSQALRHLSRVIAPSKLDEWNVSYSLDHCKPGEAIVTEPGAFHQVLNMGANYAVATNILYGSSPTVPKGYKFCQKSCGPQVITAADLRLHEEVGPLVEAQANKRVPLPRDNFTPVQSNIIPSKRKFVEAEGQANERVHLPRKNATAVPSNNIPLKRKSVLVEPQSRTSLLRARMGSLSDAVCGKEAFHRLGSHIYSWRDRPKPFFEKNNREFPAVLLVQAIGTLEKRSHLTEFLDRFAKLKLAKVIDDGLDGRMRADPTAITKLLTDLNWENTRTNRKTLHNYLVEGRQWGRICDNFDGLLCLIPPNREYGESLQVSGRVYQELSSKDIELFHSLLEANEFVQPMCRVGELFQASIWSAEEAPEFKWESEDSKEISRLSMRELAPFIGKFCTITENEYKPEKHNWPKPDRWPWDWPQHPMWVPHSERQCDLCDEEKCDCISTRLPESKPRITNEIGKGQGVRVIGSMWVKGQILGEFHGEVVPLETYHDGWSMEFIRPDLDNEPVAQIYAKEMGNWLRKVNHSCDPSAQFRVMKISGWWRQMLVAIRDIPHNGEITASCGRNFLKGQGKECLCEVCAGRPAPGQG